MGRKPNTTDLALSDEQLKNKRKMTISMNVSYDFNVHIKILQTTFKRHLNQMLHVLMHHTWIQVNETSGGEDYQLMTT